MSGRQLFSTTTLVAIAVALFTGACTKAPSTSDSAPTYTASEPIISSITTTVNEKQPSRNVASRISRIRAENAKKGDAQVESSKAVFAFVPSTALTSTVKFSKKEILNRVFLYGSDLQYSTVGEDSGMLLQSMSVGHVTARFQIIGSRLQLMAEEKYRFESNINIPLRLLHEWPITKQTADSVTVSITTGSPTLAALFGSPLPARTSWVRSVDYVTQGNYLMIESSIEMADGTVAEFMESVFPRDTLVPQNFAPILDDATLNMAASRYDFLSNGVWLDLPDGRTQTAVAQRFPAPAAGQSIDWYVTPNVPAEFIPAIRDGIEAWNRYSQKMYGRDFIKFKGTLPEGVKLGDPRYNVVNWDSVVNASAAYESQSSDPESGLQSHSLIYLPYAWVAIGRDFWKVGEITQDKSEVKSATLKASLDKMQFLGRKVDVRCFNEGELAITPAMRADPDLHAKELLKGVLFHEVGHALGLAHNFKGSLSWNPDDPKTLFTTTIMDYNQYQIEGGAFDKAGVATGPILEYDRQILSVLYNEGKDIAANDPVLAHCDDRAADSRQGGVDPFCIRYDAGHDPSVLLEKTLKLIQDPTSKLGETVSLGTAVTRAVSETLVDPASIKTADELLAVETEMRAQVIAMTQYYLAGGGQGLNYMLSANLRALSVFRAGTVPANFDGVSMRARVAGAMDTVMGMDSLSPATQKLYVDAGEAAAQWLMKTPVYAGMSTAMQVAKANSMRALPKTMLGMFEKMIFPSIRSRALQTLARTPTAPFFLSATVDYEATVMQWFTRVLIGTTAGGGRYSTPERIAVAGTLKSYAGVGGVNELKDQARQKVTADLASVKTAEERESLRALMTLLL